MRKTCVQAVQHTQKVVQNLCTKCIHFFEMHDLSPKLRSYAHICTQVVRLVAHNGRRYFTGVARHLSPLSTGLIIERNMDIKNYLEESCGKNI